jgi:hypothetical protein
MRDIQGVPGLHVVYEAFSESYERVSHLVKSCGPCRDGPRGQL